MSEVWFWTSVVESDEMDYAGGLLGPYLAPEPELSRLRWKSMELPTCSSGRQCVLQLRQGG